MRSKSTAYLVLLVMAATVMAAGCETVKGAAHGASCGFHKDVQNAGDSSKNGWAAIMHADAWIRENLW
ncbi:MAG: hypothetical protein KGK03_07920 [Candidatus Omnitrophica bacterium]|nr:hypothetical protein [Candidatus Omnitrophota bacterium]